jgi:hypothetical protein
MQDAVFSGHIGICLPAAGHGTFFATYILSDKISGDALVPLCQVQATNRHNYLSANRRKGGIATNDTHRENKGKQKDWLSGNWRLEYESLREG